MEQKQIKPEQFEAYLTVIRDGQMPQERVPGFLNENPDFKAWYLQRIDDERAPR